MVELRSQWVRASYGFATASQLAFESVRAHKLRSFLTLLGVIIGVASVILVGATIDGLGLFAEQSTAKVLGSDNFIIAQIASAGRFDRKAFFRKLRRNKQINTDDLEYLRTVNGAHSLYTAYRQTSTPEVVRESLRIEEVSILGVGAVMPEIREVNLTDGRFFTEQEAQTRQYVAVIGDEVRTTLFPDGSSPINQTVRIRGIDFRVIGTQERLGSSFGRSQDKNIYIPDTAFARVFPLGRNNIVLFGKPRAGTGLTMEAAVDLTRVALRSRFHTPPGEDDNFDILTPDALLDFIGNILGLIAAVVVPVTCISLVVGGIVIMNIMLVSVTERTREIGIRKAIGARRTDVMQQVLIEAVLLSALGGFIGVCVGALATEIVAKVFEITMRITPTYVLLSIGVSSIVGIASGWYPARRAARMDPVVALRAET